MQMWLAYLFEKDLKLNKPQNIVGNASLYGYKLTLCPVLPYIDMHSNIVGSASLYGHTLNDGRGCLIFYLNGLGVKMKKKLTSICVGQHND